MATISGFWDVQHNTTRTNFPELLKNGSESVISGIPTWSSFVISTADGRYTYAPGVDSDQIEYYHQTMSLRDGIVTTTVVWRPHANSPAYDLSFQVLAHRSKINLGMMKIGVSTADDTRLIVTDILDGEGAQRTRPAGKAVEKDNNVIWTAVNPEGLSDVVAYEYSTLDFGYG